MPCACSSQPAMSMSPLPGATEGRTMDFGVSFTALPPQHAANIARTLDDVGFESLWVPEHLFFPTEVPPAYPYTPSGTTPSDTRRPLYDPWIEFAFVAAVTERIRFGTSIYILPLRHPLATARSLVTLDAFSAGRVTLGVGVGWLETEFKWTGQSFRDRGARTDEIIPLLRRLWSDEVVEHHGTHYDFGPVAFEPKPVQRPSIPIL